MFLSVAATAARHTPSAGSIIAGLVMLAGLAALALAGLRKGAWTLRFALAPRSIEEEALAADIHALNHVRREFRQGLKEAQAAVTAARRSYRRTESAAAKHLEKAGTPAYLGRAGPIKVFDDRIVTPQGVRAMDERVHAVVDSAGAIAVTRRYTLTRFALLGPLSTFAPKATEHDTRELYLIVEHPE
jgi:hypothetical protein